LARIAPHAVVSDARDPAARTIANDCDIEDVIAVMRLNYERVVTRRARTGERE
jgi:hypothetical protein